MEQLNSSSHRSMSVLILMLIVMVGIVSPAFLTSPDVTDDSHIYDPVEPDPLPRAVDSGTVPQSDMYKEEIRYVEETSPTIDSVQVNFPSILDANTVIGYYGNPNSTRMGMLGEQDIRRTAELLDIRSQEYNLVNGDRGVIRAFHLIYATVWPDANVGRLSNHKIMEYIDFARDHDMIVILDHQIGKFGVEESLKEMLPYLSEGPVHLAIDPEWRTSIPGLEIGWVYAHEINAIQQIMQDYLEQHGVVERRMLIVHQFHPKMIQNRDEVRTDFPLVDLVLNADGFGPPALKISSWRHNADAENIPLKGFKLFYPKPWKSVGFDNPLMTPEQVMALEPQPVYINYQ